MNLKSVTTIFGAVGAVTFLTAIVAPARAADSVQVRGTIVSLDGSTLTVKTREGATDAVALKDGWEVAGVARAAPDDIKPGEFVGIASAPTAAGGDATVEVLIFPGAGKAGYPTGARPQST